MAPGTTVHATTLALGAAGILVRGPAGSGKTTLALALIDAHQPRGGFGRLVSDDRTALRVAGGRLIASVPLPLAGLVERRGYGIDATPHIGAVRLTLVVDLVPRAHMMRMPDRTVTELMGVPLAWLGLEACNTAAATLTVAAVIAAGLLDGGLRAGTTSVGERRGSWRGAAPAAPSGCGTGAEREEGNGR